MSRSLAGPEDDAKITDEGYAKLCQFKGWNTKPDGTGEWVTDLKVRDDTKDLALYAQWEIKFHLAYIGNSQTRGIDFMDNNGEEGYTVEKDAALIMSAKDDEEGYTFFRKKESLCQNFSFRPKRKGSYPGKKSLPTAQRTLTLAPMTQNRNRGCMGIREAF